MRENNNEMGKRVCDCIAERMEMSKELVTPRARFKSQGGFGRLSSASCTSAGFTGGCLAGLR